MSATLLGTTGVFGGSADESGLILDKLEFDPKMEMKKVKNRTAGTQGLSLYDDTCDISLTGAQTITSPLQPRLGSTLVLANTMPDMQLNAVSGGRIVVFNPKLSIAIEDFHNMDVKATYFPLISAT